MKKFLLNSILAILLTLAIISSTMLLVLFNDNFIIKELEKNNYYKEVERELKKDLTEKFPENSCTVDKKILKKDIDRYVKRHFKSDKIINAIKCKEKEETIDLYRDKITFSIFKSTDTRRLYYIICIIVIIIIFIVGSVFIKTQKIHNINTIFIISFFLLIICYGLLYLYVDLDIPILNIIFNKANHYLLGFGIILLEIGIYNKLKNKS